MNTLRVVAISTELAEAVRKNTKDPQFGFPVHTAEAGEDCPADIASIGSRSARSEPRFSRWIRSRVWKNCRYPGRFTFMRMVVRDIRTMPESR